MFLHVEMDYIYGALEAAGYNGAVGEAENVPPKLSRGTAFIHNDWKFVRIEYGDDGRRAFQGFFGMTAALAESGTNLIVDGFLDEAWMIPSAAASLGSQRAFLVGLHCDIDELERRERDRGDRFQGIARAFAESVHQHVPFYDIEVDTGRMSVEESVRAIVKGISNGQPQTFKALEQRSSRKHAGDR